jgi:mRNA-degrading endonuclease RelE of RelBE toxin-antitoxin system
MYEVLVKKTAAKYIEKAPQPVKDLFDELIEDLAEKGAIQPDWPNYSKLSKNKFHCHLNDSYVACWYHENKTIEIEVYYAGTRENAPY